MPTDTREAWTEGDELVWCAAPAVRLAPTGTQTVLTHAPRRRRNPGAETPRVWVGEVAWELRTEAFDATLWVGTKRVLTSTVFDAHDGVAVAALEDGVVVRHTEGVERVDATGHCVRLAKSPPRRTGAVPFRRTVFVDGGRALWAEVDDDESRLLAVPMGGGEPEVLARRAAPDMFELVDVHGGRALLLESTRRQTQSDGVTVITHHRVATSVIALPEPAASSVQASERSLTYHDSIDVLPLSDAARMALRAQGTRSVAELRDRLDLLGDVLAPKDRAEAEYALRRFERSLSDPSWTLVSIEPAFLAPVSELGLGEELARVAPTLADVVTRTLMDWLRVPGVPHATTLAMSKALGARGLTLGRAWWDLAPK